MSNYDPPNKYWDRRDGLDKLYVDTLRNMAAQMGCNTPRIMNKGMLADYIIRHEHTVAESKFIDDCIAEGTNGRGKQLYLGD